MPIYRYKHPNKENFVEVIQSMTEPHEYVDKDGKKWERIYQNPNVGISTQIDGSKESFMNATNKKCSLGDMWEASEISSEKRAKSQGKDSVKEAFHKTYSDKTKGKKIISKSEL